MLTLFRRIRKSLLGSGHTRRYILYAIGEIALVVIGILIALQVNNWNEWRKDRNKEQLYLHALNEEFHNNYEELFGDMEGRRLNIERHEQAKKYIENSKQNIDSDSLSKFSQIIDNVRFNVPSNATYDDLMKTGQLGILTSDSLRYWLMIYQQEVQRNDRVEQLDNNFVENIVIPFLIRNEQHIYGNPEHFAIGEMQSILKRRISREISTLSFNQQLLTVIENVLKFIKITEK